MKFVNFNDTIRKTMKLGIDTLIYNEKTLKAMTPEEAMIIYRDNLYDLEISDKPMDKWFREQSILCMYLDTFKICNHKQKEGLSLDQDIELFNILTNFDSSDEIIAEVSADPNFLYRLILNSYNFTSMNNLGKITLIKSLSYTENEWLSSLIPSHQLDLDIYDIEVDIPYLVDNIKKDLKYQQDNLDLKMENAIILRITGFIRNLFKTHHESGLKLALELAKIDYAGAKYLSKYIPNDDLLVEKIDFYENYLLDDILYQLVNSEVFLRNAVWMFYSIYIDKNYDSIEIDEASLDSDETRKMNKKLVLQ